MHRFEAISKCLAATGVLDQPWMFSIAGRQPDAITDKLCGDVMIWCRTRQIASDAAAVCASIGRTTFACSDLDEAVELAEHASGQFVVVLGITQTSAESSRWRLQTKQKQASRMPLHFLEYSAHDGTGTRAVLDRAALARSLNSVLAIGRNGAGDSSTKF